MSAPGSAISEPAFRPERPRHELARVLRRRRRLRAGVVQLVAALLAVLAAFVAPQVHVGFDIPTTRATEMLLAVGASTITFIGIVFSLLFLVVQFGSTAFTPRLNLFREAPVVWRAFALFTAVVVYSFTDALVITRRAQTSGTVLIVAFAGALVSIVVYRRLQMTAFTSIQLAPTLAQVERGGREVIDGLYTHPARPFETPDDSLPGHDGPWAEITWTGRAAVLQVIDVPRVLRAAERAGAMVRFKVGPGDRIAEGSVVAVTGNHARVVEQGVERAEGRRGAHLRAGSGVRSPRARGHRAESGGTRGQRPHNRGTGARRDGRPAACARDARFGHHACPRPRRRDPRVARPADLAPPPRLEQPRRQPSHGSVEPGREPALYEAACLFSHQPSRGGAEQDRLPDTRASASTAAPTPVATHTRSSHLRAIDGKIFLGRAAARHEGARALYIPFTCVHAGARADAGSGSCVASDSPPPAWRRVDNNTRVVTATSTPVITDLLCHRQKQVVHDLRLPRAGRNVSRELEIRPLGESGVEQRRDRRRL